MKIEIINNSVGSVDVLLNSVAVGTIGVSGGFEYFRSSKITHQQDDAIMDALRDYHAVNYRLNK